MTTRLDLIKEIAEEIAGRDRVGPVLSGTATSAVLGGLVNVTADDTWAEEDLLQFPEAGIERTVTGWNPQEGEASWEGARSGTYTDETFVLQPRPAYTLNEIRRSINDCLSQLQRTYRMVLPAIPDTYEYPLNDLPWLTSDGRVDDVVFCESPNLLHNEDFSLWQEPSAPDAWTPSGAAATVTKVSGGTWGPYAARVTRSGTDAHLSQFMPVMLVQWLVRRADVTYKTVHVGAWVKSSTASVARVGVYDGTSTTWSDYHSGSGGWEWLTASLMLSSSVSELTVVNSVDTSDASADFSGTAFTVGEIPEPLHDRGSKAYLSYPIPYLSRNVGGTPVVEVKQRVPQHGQLIVWSRRPFAELSNDTDVTEADRETVVSGSIMRMLEIHKSGQDRSRLDVVLAKHARKYALLASNLIDIPIAAPMRSVYVGSA